MKITKALAAAAAVAAAGSIVILGAPVANADELTTTTLGNEAKLTNGDVVQGWTISDLKASTDVIPYAAAGTLWEATATDQALEGSVTPIVSNLNARARSGETYRVLFGVATPQGVNPATLAQGQKTTGKVYFDVVGDTPDSVVYNAGGPDLLVWVQPPPQLSTPGAGAGYRPSTPSTTATPTTPTTGAVPGEPAGLAGTPVPGAPPAPGAALPAGSQGTPIPATGSQGTPLAPGSQGTPLAPGSQGTPLAPGSQGTPLPAGSSGTPAAPAGTEGVPQPAAVQQAPAGVQPAPAGVQQAPPAAGSQGTPLPANGPAPVLLSPAPVVPPGA